MSAERLARIGDWLDGVIERKEAAGFVTLVARRGKVVHHEAHGNRGMSVKEPMPSDALFDLASMTKPITVAVALMLLEEGRFTLTDPISKYLPEFKDRGVRVGEHAIVPAESEITVQQLFTHTSGVGATWTRAEKFEYTTLKEYMQALAGLPLNFPSQARRGCTVTRTTCWVIWWRRFPSSRWESLCNSVFSIRWGWQTHITGRRPRRTIGERCWSSGEKMTWIRLHGAH